MESQLNSKLIIIVIAITGCTLEIVVDGRIVEQFE